MALPLSPNLAWTLANPKWAAALNPVLANPMNQVSFLKNIALVTGNNVINHGLGKTLQGWIIVDIQGAATIYRNTPLNDLTLGLSSSANVIVSLGVF